MTLNVPIDTCVNNNAFQSRAALAATDCVDHFDLMTFRYYCLFTLAECTNLVDERPSGENYVCSERSSIL